MFESAVWTGCILAIALFACVNAQSSEGILSISTGSFRPTTKDYLGSATRSISLAVPTGTGRPCARIAAAVETSSSSFTVAVPAELAYDCLTSVPVKRSAALGAIDAVEKMAQFQSNLAYLKNPPKDYDNPPVDILAGLADIRDRVSKNDFSNQYEFEAAIASLLNSARDGHLGFDGPTFVGAVRWRRDPSAVLISLSLDGGPAKTYNLVDFNHTSSPSPISQIDGEEVNVFLQKEANWLTYHDPDTRWNALFYRLSAQSLGVFVTPQWYPGPTTTLLLENGTEQIYKNQAILREESSWAQVFDGDSFYSTFVDSSSGRRLRREPTLRTTQQIPKRLQQIREDTNDDNADIPLGFPEPYITGPSDVYINGYFVDHPKINHLAVLSLQTFDTNTDQDAQRFQFLIQQFLAEAKFRSSEKIIIDVQSNGGGRVFLGYDAFLQFFPNIEPFGGTRFRGHESANILGAELSRLSFSQSGFGYTSPFNYHSFITRANEPFTSWPDMYNGSPHNGDNFTNILRYNLSDPNLISSTTYGEGITITGQGDRANFTTPPFNASDIILLTDGICGSTCSLFVEFMTLQAGVKTIVLGGRPQNGPMQPVGGTKGTNVLTSEYLNTFSEYLLTQLASSASERQAWASILPEPFPIQAYDASVNFLDNVREGDEDMTPSQFTNETANCRLWYTRKMATDIKEVWKAVADAAWGGKDGGIDQSKCVPGSYRKESLLEDPPISADGKGGGSRNKGSTNGSEKQNAVASTDVRRSLAILSAFVVSFACL